MWPLAVPGSWSLHHCSLYILIGSHEWSCFVFENRPTILALIKHLVLSDRWEKVDNRLWHPYIHYVCMAAMQSNFGSPRHVFDIFYFVEVRNSIVRRLGGGRTVKPWCATIQLEISDVVQLSRAGSENGRLHCDATATLTATRTQTRPKLISKFKITKLKP